MGFFIICSACVDHGARHYRRSTTYLPPPSPVFNTSKTLWLALSSHISKDATTSHLFFTNSTGCPFDFVFSSKSPASLSKPAALHNHLPCLIYYTRTYPPATSA